MKTYRIGTRGSPLALAQTQEFIKALLTYHPSLKDALEIVPIRTRGDTLVDRKLTDLGGKSLFTKEIEIALLKGTLDFAVHSMKDVTVNVPEGLVFAAMLKRGDPRDVLITKEEKSFNELPPGTRFGTSSLRRQAFILSYFPHFEVVPLRGNVTTRLEKLERGEIDAMLLAAAGLKRLGLLEKATEILSLSTFIPAIGQGALGIQCRTDDVQSKEILKPLNHLLTFQAVTAERAFMKVLNGSCRMPIAAYAYIENDEIILNGMLGDSDGKNMRYITQKGPTSDPISIGEKAAHSIQEKS